MPQAVLQFLPSAISAGGSIFGGLFGQSAAQKAAQQMAQSQQKVVDLTNQATAQGQDAVATGQTNANDILSRSAATQLGMYSPYAQTGTDSLSSLYDLASATGPLTQQFSFNPSDLSSDPGYQFTLQQGQQAIQRAAAAQGGLFSSGTLKSLAGYTTGTANQYFNDAFNRSLQTFNTNRQGALSRINTLQGLANLGYGATSAGAGAVGGTSAQQAQNTLGASEFNANLGMEGNRQIAGALTNQGNALAGGTVGGANAFNSGFGGAINTASKAIGDWLAKRQGSSSVYGAPYVYPQPVS